MKYLFLGIIIIGVLLALVPHVIYIMVRLVGLMAHFRIGYRPFGVAALILVAVWIVIAIYGNIYGRFRHEVKQVQLSFESLPASFDGLRIIQSPTYTLTVGKGTSKNCSSVSARLTPYSPISSASQATLSPYRPTS